MTNSRKRRSKVYCKSTKCTDDTDSDSDIICSQGKLQELKQAQMSTKTAKVPLSKKLLDGTDQKLTKKTMTLVYNLYNLLQL